MKLLAIKYYKKDSFTPCEAMAHFKQVLEEWDTNTQTKMGHKQTQTHTGEKTLII
jgi:hypothetical protein